MKTRLFLLLFIATWALFCIYSCSPKAYSPNPDWEDEVAVVDDDMDEAEPPMEWKEPVEAVPSKKWTTPHVKDESPTEIDTENAPKTTTKNDNKPSFDNYEVMLEASKKIPVKKTGNMVVWIGDPKYKPAIDTNMVRDTRLIPADICQYAIITPIAPNFDVEPKVSKPIKIHPSGISETFTLTPIKGKRGDLKVQAKIEFFDNENCIGTSISKTTAILTVEVKVIGIDLLRELWDILWDKFIILYAAILGVLSYIAIRFIKRKAKIEDEGVGKLN
jgi:hypothetical protein